MNPEINHTHDAGLRSWVESANDPASEFPIQNLPFCVIDRAEEGDEEDLRIAVAIGDQVCDLLQLASSGVLFEDEDDPVLFALQLEALNLLMALEPRDVSRLRSRLIELFREDVADLRDEPELRAAAMIPLRDAHFVMPVEVGDYTDFYASLHHATNVGSMFRPDNALLPNYKHIPIGYHGRASTLVVSGTAVHRPSGQTIAADGETPSFGPCKLLDYELEVGAFVGRGNEMGSPIGIGEIHEHLFGICLVNDWSARDMQKWEYQPLGPFLAKSFATTVSPFVVTAEALAPFRSPAPQRSEGDPAPLDYLVGERDQRLGAIGLTVEAYLSSRQMREQGLEPMRLSRANFKDMYWTLGQMLTHHASNGCAMLPGDLIASGTVSGPGRGSRGCMLELTWDGDPWATPPIKAAGTDRTPLKLPTGEERRFLQDGDEVILRGYCERDGFRRIGLGECRGVVVG